MYDFFSTSEFRFETLFMTFLTISLSISLFDLGDFSLVREIKLDGGFFRNVCKRLLLRAKGLLFRSRRRYEYGSRVDAILSQFLKRQKFSCSHLAKRTNDNHSTTNRLRDWDYHFTNFIVNCICCIHYRKLVLCVKRTFRTVR